MRANCHDDYSLHGIFNKSQKQDVLANSDDCASQNNAPVSCEARCRFERRINVHWNMTNVWRNRIVANHNRVMMQWAGRAGFYLQYSRSKAHYVSFKSRVWLNVYYFGIFW